MKKQNIIIVAVIIFLLGVVQSSDVYSQDLPGRCDDKEQNLMRTQADAFLRGMPSDLQQRQTTAIMQAIDYMSQRTVRTRRFPCCCICMVAAGLLAVSTAADDSAMPWLHQVR